MRYLNIDIGSSQKRIILVLSVFVAVIVFTLSFTGFVQAWETYEPDETEEVTPEPADHHPPEEPQEQENSESPTTAWRDEPAEEAGISTEEVVEHACEAIPAGEDLDEELKPLMKVEVANLALNIENAFFESPESCDEVIEEWIE